MSNIRDNANFDEFDQAAIAEFHQLCSRLYDDVISEPEVSRLNQLLSESGAARKLYLRYVSLHGMLLASAGKHERSEAEALRRHVTAADQDEENGPDDPCGVALVAEVSTARQSLPKRHWLNWAVAASLLVTATGLVLWQVDKPNHQAVRTTNENAIDQPSAAAPDADQPVAEAQLSHVSVTARWQQDHQVFHAEAVVYAGEVLALAQGEIELTYRTGTKLLLIGPAEFLVESAGGKLRKGNLVASVTKAGYGFTIETPTGRVVDLGTEFAVTVDDFGVSEVSVFQGKVEAFPHSNRNRSEKVELTEGHGLQWNQDRLIPFDADLRHSANPAPEGTPGRTRVDGKVSFVDRFRTAALDAETWKTLGDAQTSTTGLQLKGGNEPGQQPYLISAEQFDPSLGPITVTCDFRFAQLDSADATSFSVLTRSTDVRGIALPPWNGTLASCARCSFGAEQDSGGGLLQTGVKMESDRELTSDSWSGFLAPAPGTPYRMVIRDDGVNVSFTISLRDQPSISKTVTFRSLFRGKANYVAFEGSRQGTTLIERAEISQELPTTPLVSYADFSLHLLNGRKQHEIEQRLLDSLAPDDAVPVLEDNFAAERLDVNQWKFLGDIVVRDGAAQLGTPNDEGRIDTWKARPYLLTRQRLDPQAGALTIIGRISFADNFRAGYGASFAVMTRADDRHGRGPGWENSVLQRGVRANFWPAAWDAEHRLEIHEKPVPNTITLLATQGGQVDPKVRSYLFRVIDDGRSVTLTIVDPGRPEEVMTVSATAASKLNQGIVGFESCWGSPVSIDDVRIYQDQSPGKVAP